MEAQKVPPFLNNIQQYLRKYPVPSSIEYFQGLFKLASTYTVPHTDSKNTKQWYYAPSGAKVEERIQNSNKKLTHNAEKGRVEEVGSFQSIATKQKHQKVLQDDVFGKAEHHTSSQKWIYIAEVKQKDPKSYFNQGTGKAVFKHDFGETYQNVKEVGIFVWDKKKRNVFRIQIKENLIPCYPSFINQQGNQIIFHAYERQSFGHGLVFCFNRPIKLFKATFEVKSEAQGQNKNLKEKEKQKETYSVDVIELFEEDKNLAKVFPAISPCFNYLIYMSGTGTTHTFYKDFVICKKEKGLWIQTFRLKDRVIGYNSTLKNYILVQNGKTYGLTQTNERGSAHILKIDLENGEVLNLTQKFVNHSFQITSIDQGVIVGIVTTNSFNTFFYIKQNTVNFIQPLQKDQFIQIQYNQPIHSILVLAKQQDIFPQYRTRSNKRPLIVLPHGGPHGSFAPALTCLRYMLLKMGYCLLHPNFSGSIGYGRQFLQGSLSNVGKTDADQIIQVLKKVLEDNKNIDKENVHTQGGSYGGYMSAIFASRYSSFFRSAIILNGVLNIIGNLWFSDIPQWSTVETLSTDKIHKLGKQDYEAMLKQSPTSEPMKIPILQFLGGKDRRVPWRQGLLFDAITKLNEVPITTYVYQNSGHSLADSVQTTMDIIIKTILFLEQFNKSKQQKTQQIGQLKQ